MEQENTQGQISIDEMVLQVKQRSTLDKVRWDMWGEFPREDIW